MNPSRPQQPNWLGVAIAIGTLGVALTCSSYSRMARDGEAPAPAQRPASPEPAFAASASPEVRTEPPARQDASNGEVGAELVEKDVIPKLEQALPRFYGALRALKTQERKAPVRVAWFGDSHTAADIWPHTVRRALESAYGSAGPGFVHLGLAGFRRAGVSLSHTGRWVRLPNAPAGRDKTADGVFGLGGVAAVPKHKSAWARVSLVQHDPAEPIMRQLCFRLPPGAAFVARIGTESIPITRGAAAGDATALECRPLPEARADAELSVERAVGDPRILGAVLERKVPGVVLDTLGINGARIATQLGWDEQSFIEVLRARSPDLIILAYGTNEVFDAVDVGKYPDQYRRVLQRMRQALPDVECLLLGPPDALGERGGSHERVRSIDLVQARAALDLGCGYLSSFELMGGDGSFSRWMQAEPALARRDGIHLTPLGYQRLGEEVVQRLLPR